MSRSETWRKRAGELAASFALLTRLPVGRFVPPDETQAVWAYPIVGATVAVFLALISKKMLESRFMKVSIAIRASTSIALARRCSSSYPSLN